MTDIESSVEEGYLPIYMNQSKELEDFAVFKDQDGMTDDPI